MSNIDNLLTQVNNLSESDLKHFSRQAMQKIPVEVTSEALTGLMESQPKDKRKGVAKQLTDAVTNVPGSVVPPPLQSDVLWIIVVSAFAFVLCLSFVTLACGVLWQNQGNVKPELILTMFTSVVGFLAGLFVPSPVSRRPQT
jgi:hypothetical protein